MYSRDYILRLIQQFGRTLIALRNRLLGRQADQAEMDAAIAEIARHAGLDLDIARRLDPPSLLMWLSPTEEVDPSRMWLMAELLYLAALAALPDDGVAIWNGRSRSGSGCHQTGSHPMTFPLWMNASTNFAACSRVRTFPASNPPPDCSARCR